MKRVRDEELVDLTTGEILRGDELFSDKQRTLLILAQSDFKTVSAFEQSSKRARALVVDNAVWRYLFERDYPYTYATAIKPGSWRMRESVRVKIDAYTIEEREGRGETYWKRYYEFLVKNKRQIDAHERVRHVGTAYNPRGWTVQTQPGYISLYQYKERHDDERFVNPSGLLYVRMAGWILRREPGTNKFYFYPANYANVATLVKPAAGENHPKMVVRFDMNNFTHSAIPWFPEVGLYEFIDYRRGTGVAYIQSIDGFRWFVFSGARAPQIFILKPDVRDILVSTDIACSACDTTRDLSTCVCCSKVYCSMECQSVDHK